ncbi:MAG: CDP-alcohol phosphatidyltransferase family protein [Steroidobacteraceae bacterium]
MRRPRPTGPIDGSVRRAPEIEDPTNLYLIHPLASRLTAALAALHVRPNAVSLAGMACGLLAGGAYFRYRDVHYAIAGFLLMLAWHVLDGADGQLARLTHAQSHLGKILDGVCDYVTFIAVYVALAASFSERSGSWIWALAVAAGVCHAVQSAAYEAQREDYTEFGLGRPPAVSAARGTATQRGSGAPPVPGLLQGGYRLYVGLQRAVGGIDSDVRARLSAAASGEPGRAALLRQRYRETFAPAVRRWSVLSANYRTLGIFIAAALAAPQYYFAFEIVGFSAILAVLRLDQRARYARFLRS